MNLHVEVNQADMRKFKDLLKRVGSKGLPAMSRAINKTLSGSRSGTKGATATGGLITVSTDIMKEEINLLSTVLKKGPGTKGHVAKKNKVFMVEKATPTKPSGKLSVKGKNIPLIHYTNQRGNRSTHAKKITVQVRKDRGKVRLKHAFVPTLRSGHRGVFNQMLGGDGKPLRNSRTGNIRIRELYGPRIPDIFSNKNVLDQRVMPKADELLTKNLNHEIDWLLMKETENQRTTGG